MFIRPIFIRKNGKRYAYWTLVKSHQTLRGSRQETVAYLGKLEEAERRTLQAAAEGRKEEGKGTLLPEAEPPSEWIEVDASRVRLENGKAFGGAWLGLEVMGRLGLVEFLKRRMPRGEEDVPWPMMALVLVLSRLCEPSSELYIAEHLYAGTALEELLGVPAEKVNDDRLYRALDALRPHKEALEGFLKERMGALFQLDYDLLLYDVTSTYFEGQAQANPLAQRGHSRDHRGDCKQVCIGLVVSRDGMPLGYEVFAGNTADRVTLRPIVETMERRYGKAHRIWVVDRGMVDEKNLEVLRAEGRKYIVGTPKGLLKRFEAELLKEDWRTVREGLEVKLCPSPEGQETFILCRSQQRREKEKGMHARFEQRLEADLVRIQQGCRKQHLKATTVAGRLARALTRNSRAAGLFQTEIVEREGRTQLVWSKQEAWREWVRASEGCYLLRSNVAEWSAEDLWRAYIQLTEAEAAFRIEKSDLGIRPIWHQTGERVQAHILVCFLAYVVWKTLDRMCRSAGLGDEPRRVLNELSAIQAVDVVLPARNGIEIRKRCVTKPTDHQAILLQRLGLRLPSRLKTTDS